MKLKVKNQGLQVFRLPSRRNFWCVEKFLLDGNPPTCQPESPHIRNFFWMETCRPGDLDSPMSLDGNLPTWSP